MFGGNFRKSLPKRGIKKMDAVITGFILGGIVASIYGIKKTEEHRVKEELLHPKDISLEKHSFASIIKMLVLGVPVEKPEKPATLYSKFLSFFR